MRPIVVTVGPLAGADTNAIAESQTPAAGVAFTLDGTLVSGGVAVLDTPRRVLVTYGTEAADRTIEITGTNWSGQPIGETVTVADGGPGTVASVLDYATVSSIVSPDAFDAAVEVGTNGVAASPWVRLDDWNANYVTVQCVASGTVNYTVQQTLDDPNSLTNPVAPQDVTWSSSADTAVVGATATKISGFQYAPCFVRVLLNSGSGSVTTTVLQSATPAR